CNKNIGKRHNEKIGKDIIKKIVRGEVKYTGASKKILNFFFAILLWEISAQQIPFNDLAPEMASERVKKGEHPNPFLESTPKQYIEIVMQAWDKDHNNRPQIDYLHEQLKNMKEDAELHQNGSATFASVAPIKKSKHEVQLPPLLPIEQVITFHKEKKYEEAFIQFEQLAQNNDPLALYYTGLYLYEGYGIRKDVI
ncbi:2095_t:CDS:2, partial [Racocetra persica]